MTASQKIRSSRKLQRIWALVRKESLEVVRDPSSIAIGILMPVALVLLFGYGLSLDIKNVPVAVVMEDSSSDARELAASFRLSPYFDAEFTTSMPHARALMAERKIEGVVRIRSDFSRNLAKGDVAVQVMVQGVDANTARIIQTYAQGAVGQWAARQGAEGKATADAPVTVLSRLWFNESNDSHYFLVPGLVVLVMTLIGALLTALSVAREREEGTFDQLLVTPFRPVELMAGKAIPSVLIGLIQATLVFLVAQLWFRIPFAGSFVTLYAALALFVLAAVGIGLLISSVVANMQQAMLFSFVVLMPLILLSGLTTPVENMPAVLQYFTLLNPLRYAIDIIHRIYLEAAGLDSLVPELWPLAIIGAITLLAASWMFRNRLG